MGGWKSGDLTSVGAGLVLALGAFAPWVELSAAGRVRYVGGGSQAGLLAFTLIAAAALVVFGARRSSWTALVALIAAFVVAFVVFTAAIGAHADGAHPGFGIFAIGAAGILALVTSVLNAIERETPGL